MNKSEVKTFNEMKIMVEGISNTVENIDITLNGKKEDRHDLGLVGDVRNNVKWRDKVNKTLSALGIGVILLFIKEGWQQFLKKGG